MFRRSSTGHAMTTTYPLYDPLQHHDACGVGFVADRTTRVSHRIVRLGVECLHNLDHRGARSADGTGDGAGMMTRIPHRLIERELRAQGVEVPERDALGLVMVFLPKDRTDDARRVIESALAANAIDVLSWRVVPIGANVLSPTAKASLPVIEQVIVSAPRSTDPEDFEKALFLARKAIERQEVPGLDIVSASCRTVVYKGLFTADTIEGFYWDLRDPVYESDFASLPPALFHQHGARMGARPAVPHARTQRRDQHRPGQQGVDGSAIERSRGQRLGIQGRGARAAGAAGYRQ